MFHQYAGCVSEKAEATPRPRAFQREEKEGRRKEGTLLARAFFFRALGPSQKSNSCLERICLPTHLATASLHSLADYEARERPRRSVVT